MCKKLDNPRPKFVASASQSLFDEWCQHDPEGSGLALLIKHFGAIANSRKSMTTRFSHVPTRRSLRERVEASDTAGFLSFDHGYGPGLYDRTEFMVVGGQVPFRLLF